MQDVLLDPKTNTMVSLDDYGNILADVLAFIPEGRIDIKNRSEKIDYRTFIETGKCIACGDNVVDYEVIEQFVLYIEDTYGVEVCGIAFDRYNVVDVSTYPTVFVLLKRLFAAYTVSKISVKRDFTFVTFPSYLY